MTSIFIVYKLLKCNETHCSERIKMVSNTKYYIHNYVETYTLCKNSEIVINI